MLKNIRQSIKKSNALSSADVRLAAYMGLVTADVQRPTGFNDGVFYPSADVPLAAAPAHQAAARRADAARDARAAAQAARVRAAGRLQRQQGQAAGGGLPEDAVRPRPTRTR